MTNIDQATEYATKAARLLNEAEPLLFRTDTRPATQLIAAAGVWAQLAQVAVFIRPEPLEDPEPLAGYDVPELP